MMTEKRVREALDKATNHIWYASAGEDPSTYADILVNCLGYSKVEFEEEILGSPQIVYRMVDNLYKQVYAPRKED